MTARRRRMAPGEGAIRKISSAADQVQSYPSRVTFRCPVTGLDLESPPLSEVIDEGHRLIAASADNALILAADRIHVGQYRMAATRLRLIADRLDSAADTLDEWAERRMGVAV